MKHALKAALSVAFLLFASMQAMAIDRADSTASSAATWPLDWQVQSDLESKTGAAMGDFNGDGIPDVAFVVQNYDPPEAWSPKYHKGDKNITNQLHVLLSEKSDGDIYYRPDWLLTKSSPLLKKTEKLRYQFNFQNLTVIAGGKVVLVQCDEDYLKNCHAPESQIFTEKLVGYKQPLAFYNQPTELIPKHDALISSVGDVSYLFYYDKGKFQILRFAGRK